MLEELLLQCTGMREVVITESGGGGAAWSIGSGATRMSLNVYALMVNGKSNRADPTSSLVAVDGPSLGVTARTGTTSAVAVLADGAGREGAEAWLILRIWPAL